MKKLKVFVNNDLDSAGALMVIKWVFGDKCIIDHSVSNAFNIKGDYERFTHSVVSNSYCKIFIVNLLPDFDLDDNTFVFTKTDRPLFKYKGKMGHDISTTNLVYKFFTKSLGELSDKQHILLDTINSLYDRSVCNKAGIRLNAVFSFGRNKTGTFYDRFINGLDKYTNEEECIITAYINRLSVTYKKLKLFTHADHKKIYVALVDDMEHKNEILNLLHNKYEPDMVFLVDLDSGYISVRKSHSYKYDMQKLCTTLIEGYACGDTAGGKYTEKFIDFSRAFG